MSTIPLHKDRGLDPHMTFCRRCGEVAEELTVGELRKAEINGQWVYANRGRTHEAKMALIKQKLLNYGDTLHWQEVMEGERVPAQAFCNKCEEELEQWKMFVGAGGLYFKCKECGATGVIKYTDTSKAMCDEVREKLGVPAPEPAGVEFDTCDQHGTERTL